MAKETMKAKIERLERENTELKEIVKGADKEIQKLKDENKSMQTTLELNEEFYKDNDTIIKKLDETLILSAKKNQKIKALEEEIQKLKSEKATKSNRTIIQENQDLQRELKAKDDTIKQFCADKMRAEEEVKKVEKQKVELCKAYKKDLERVQKEKENINIKHNERGAGRKNRFNAQEIETIKLMRLRGDKIKDIAEQFDCSVGLIHKLINENK